MCLTPKRPIYIDFAGSIRCSKMGTTRPFMTFRCILQSGAVVPIYNMPQIDALPINPIIHKAARGPRYSPLKLRRVFFVNATQTSQQCLGAHTEVGRKDSNHALESSRYPAVNSPAVKDVLENLQNKRLPSLFARISQNDRNLDQESLILREKLRGADWKNSRLHGRALTCIGATRMEASARAFPEMPGAIGYSVLGEALALNLKTAYMRLKAGSNTPLKPTAKSVEAAVMELGLSFDATSTVARIQDLA